MCLVLSKGFKKKKIHISTPGIAPIRLQIKCDATQSPLKKIHFAINNEIIIIIIIIYF